uniref:V-SNARE coiled-coil homology domain-containing protein n=1 Tax=Caenorhabditis japonica TaxID=281687 RepID=A0A8R1DFR9_CAEJA
MSEKGNNADQDLEQGGNSTYDSKRIQMAQAQVNEVVDVMRSNVNKVMEREAQLNSLDHRAEVLQNGASQFQQSSRTLRQKYWWQNARMMLIIVFIVSILVIILGIWIFN